MREQFYEQQPGDAMAWLAEDEPELFCEDGHLSDAGLQALLDGRLDELGRLEAAEHLGFCQPCLERYTALLTGDALSEPGADLAPTVAWRLRQKSLRVNLRRYAAAAAAAAVALTLWGSGIFHQMAPQSDELLRPQPAASQPARVEAPGAGVSGFVHGVLGAAGELCSGLFSQGWQSPAPQKEPEQPEKEPETKEPETGSAQPGGAAGQQAEPDARRPADEQRARWAQSQDQRPARTPATAMRGEE